MSKVKYQKRREKLKKEIWQKINDPKTKLCCIFEKAKGDFMCRRLADSLWLLAYS